MTYRINIQLDEQEFIALRNVSQVQLRHPRDQARLILRTVLLGEPSPTGIATKEKTAINACMGNGGLIEVTR